ncbi:MAG: T9SS type A sorting domain-containing protein [Candidatus Marinimicrobia bacterium]|nr:T9SS type A sorting domain-containing protein [Candidatus Neomarinimicrobiota bacterium]
MHFLHRSTFFSLTMVILLITSFLVASDWKLNPGMFNPSGVPSLTFSQPRFADMDADGDMDLILGSTVDKPMYLSNTGTATSPQFTFIEDIFSSVSALDVEMGVCYDIDADGDLDLIGGGFNGIQLYLNTGNAVAAIFTKSPDYFIGISASRNPIIDMGDIDNDGDLDMVVGFSEDGAVKVYTNSGTNSAASFLDSSVQTIGDVGLYAYPVFCDPDNDGDLDILCGRDGYNFNYYKNTGSNTNPNWNLNTTVFSGLGADTYFNSPAMVDINGDGKEDLIYGNYTGPLNYYRNSGTTSTPAWTVNTTLFGGVIDVGGASTPFFIDKDGDGDLDMITGTQMGDIKSYLNNGTATAPSFSNVNTHGNLKHSIYSFVSLAEANGDDSWDALVGDLSGNIYYHVGSGTGFVPASSALTISNVGDWSSPRFIDMDHDGDQDIAVGNGDGYLIYFENLGSASQPLWTEVYNYFDSLNVGYNCVPAFADLDFDGDYDLLAGGGYRKPHFYENVDGNWVEDTMMVEGIETKQNASPAFADLDGDGDQDLILGNYDGYFDYYENLREVVAVKPLTALPNDFALNSYPNPFNPNTAISFYLSTMSDIELNIYDVTGKKVQTIVSGMHSSGQHTFNFTAPETMSTSIYFCRLMVNGVMADTKKITLLK